MKMHTPELVSVLILEFLLIWFAWTAFINEDTLRLSVAISSMILILVPSLMEYLLSIRLPTGTHLAVAAALIIHVAGGINEYYWIYAPYYDKVAHCVSGFALGLVLFSALLYLCLRGIRMSPSRILAGIIILVFIFGVIWEIGELAIDAMIGSSYNLGVEDTFFDVVGNTLGSLLAAAYASGIMRAAAPEKPVYSVLRT